MTRWTLENIPDEYKHDGRTGQPVPVAELEETVRRLNRGDADAIR